MFLHGSHSPAAGSSEGHAGGWKKSSQCLQSLQTGMGWDGMGRPRLLPPRPVALFSRSPPTPRRNFLAGGEAAARQGQQQPNLEA